MTIPNTVQKLKKENLLRHSSAVGFRVSNVHQFPGFLVSNAEERAFFCSFVCFVCFYT